MLFIHTVRMLQQFTIKSHYQYPEAGVSSVGIIRIL